MEYQSRILFQRNIADGCRLRSAANLFVAHRSRPLRKLNTVPSRFNQIKAAKKQEALLDDEEDYLNFDSSSDKFSEKEEEKLKFRIRKFERKKKKKSFFFQETFEQIGVNPKIIEALSSINVEHPSQIQGLGFEAFCELGVQRNMLLVDQAGSGKTLAYLLPILQKFTFEQEDGMASREVGRQPKAVIIVPTAELCLQVLNVCRSIAKKYPFRSIAMTGNRPMTTQTEALKEGVDVAVCTPSRLLLHLKKNTMNLENCSTIVLDEVDILLGMGFDFREDMLKVLDHVKSGTQFLLTTATIPGHVYNYLRALFDDVVLVIGPNLHCTSAGVKEQLIDCSGGDEMNEETGQARKLQAMHSLLKFHKHRRTLIFCNKIETCRKVENYLKRQDKREDEYRVLAYHSAVDASIRNRNFATFSHSDLDSKPMVLVSTDRASRGLDTCNVDHVMLFDFPRDPSEYVRRVGRTARGAAQEGLVSILVLGRQVSFAMSALWKSKEGLPIHDIPGKDLREDV